LITNYIIYRRGINNLFVDGTTVTFFELFAVVLVAVVFVFVTVVVVVVLAGLVVLVVLAGGIVGLFY
jgi:hypothetical protein